MSIGFRHDRRFADDDLERKLLNWQAWSIGGDHGNPLGFAMSRIFDVRARAGYREAIVPILAGEARDVNECVYKLSQRLRTAIIEQYLQPQKTVAERARVLGVSRRTFDRYVEEAKVHINRLLREMYQANRNRARDAEKNVD